MDDRLMSYLHCFNVRQDYFECHEYGESLWLDTGRPEILKGLIQTAVCIYHLEGGNVRGGFRMWTRARKYLENYIRDKSTFYEGIDIHSLRIAMDHLWDAVPASWRTQTIHRDEVSKLGLPRVHIPVVPKEVEETILSWTPGPIDECGD